jgi:TRAP-type uncharacterized transport system substrate-binding protein
MASELVGGQDFRPQQAMVLLRPQGATNWELSLFASDSAAAVTAVSDGSVTLGIVNPSVVLSLACRGVPPFRGPLPLRAVAVIPSGDQLVLAVRRDTGLTSTDELVQRKAPLRVTLRGQRDHSVHLVLDHVLQAAGCSLADLRAWGGAVSYDEGLPARGDRLARALSGEVDAVFDEAAGSWLPDALAGGLVPLRLPGPALDRLQSWGYRRTWLRPDAFPGLDSEVETVDFSGFAVFVREDAPDDLVRRVCAALHARRDRITDQNGDPLDIGAMVSNTPEAPLDVPLHRAAADFWEEQGSRVHG